MLRRRLYSYPIPGPGEYYRRSVPDSMEGIEVEIARMIETVRQSVGDPLMISTARAIVSSVPAKDKLAEMAAIDAWLRQNVRYINDPPEKEVIETPVRMMRELSMPPEALGWILGPYLSDMLMGRIAPEDVPAPYRMLRGIGINIRSSEDCDGMAVFAASLLGAAGIKPRFAFGGNFERGKCQLHHVWVQGLTQNGWVDMDITEPGVPLGWYYKGFSCYEVREIFEDQKN